MPKLSKYEQHALKEIHSWKAPDIGWFGQALKVINQPLDKAGDLLFKTPVVGSTIQSAIEGLTSVCHDAAQWSVRPEAIFEEFRGDGHSTIKTHMDIHDLDLAQIDKVVGFLGAKY
ncbi:hypothetical protein [Pseudomonas bubulae]|nr:hypothetical protein [Pseudomonas bubulae]